MPSSISRGKRAISSLVITHKIRTHNPSIYSFAYSYPALPYLKTLTFEWNRPNCEYSGKSHLTSRQFPIKNFDLIPSLERVELINYYLDWEYFYFNTPGWTSNKRAPTLDLSRSTLSVFRSVVHSAVTEKLFEFVEEGRIILGKVHEY